MYTVLIVDDDPSYGDMLCRVVEEAGHAWILATTAKEGLKAVEQRDFDLVFLDVRLPDQSGLNILSALKTARSRPEVIVITGLGDQDGAELALRNGAWDYLEKTASINALNLCMSRALQYRREKGGTRIAALKRQGILGEAQGLLSCLDVVAQAAPSMGPVLLTGETGTGKELFARAIHANSPRTAGSFVVVDCAALPESLAEALLFGHERGAFTGATTAKPGLINEAHGGTLFLDEIGELPLDVQKKFLRVLQNCSFRPVAGKKEAYSDFRLISASNKNLDDMADLGAFRSDLLYRLRSFALHLPPLRERLEDIPILATSILDRLARESGLGRKGVSADFMDVLCSHNWPGNVRELNQCLHSAFAKALHDETIHPVDLPLHLRVKMKRTALEQDQGEPQGFDAPLPCARDLPPLKRFREQMDGCYLRKLMLQSQGDIGEARRISGLSRSRLYGLLKAHGLNQTRS